MLYLIAIGVVVLIILVYSIRQSSVESNKVEKPKTSAEEIEELERKADYFVDLLKKDADLNVREARTFPWMLRMVSLVEEWYLQLKERDKHSTKKALEHARDWYDLVYQLWELKNWDTQDMLGNHGDLPLQEWHHGQNKFWIPITEIRKRFAKELSIDLTKIDKDEAAEFDREMEIKKEQIFKNIKKPTKGM